MSGWLRHLRSLDFHLALETPSLLAETLAYDEIILYGKHLLRAVSLVFAIPRSNLNQMKLVANAELPGFVDRIRYGKLLTDMKGYGCSERS
ncbi:hypothetical protein QE152_g26230 [Popillia japonica]|uniref:Uncharacterized protein n=1 Tax=Popillia japonica TaxID=7064 RepID=A0AAW1JZH0_POPJA